MRLFTYLCCALLGVQIGAQTSPEQPLIIHARLAPEFTGAVSGRLLIFIGPGTGAKEVDTNPFHPSQVYVAAKEVQGWLPGATVDIDANDTVFPGPLSNASPGDYQLQAVLDNHIITTIREDQPRILLAT